LYYIFGLKKMKHPEISCFSRYPQKEVSNSRHLRAGSSIALTPVGAHNGGLEIISTGPVTIGGGISIVEGQDIGRPGNITIRSTRAEVTMSDTAQVVTTGMMGSSVIVAAEKDVHLNGLFDLFYKPSGGNEPTFMEVYSFAGDVVIKDGRLSRSGDPRGITIHANIDLAQARLRIQAERNLTINGHPFYDRQGTINVKNGQTGARGGIIELRSFGSIALINRAIDNANGENKNAEVNVFAHDDVTLTTSLSKSLIEIGNHGIATNTTGVTRVRAYTGTVTIQKYAQLNSPYTKSTRGGNFVIEGLTETLVSSTTSKPVTTLPPEDDKIFDSLERWTLATDTE